VNYFLSRPRNPSRDRLHLSTQLCICEAFFPPPPPLLNTHVETHPLATRLSSEEKKAARTSPLPPARTTRRRPSAAASPYPLPSQATRHEHRFAPHQPLGSPSRSSPVCEPYSQPGARHPRRRRGLLRVPRHDRPSSRSSS